MILYGNNFTEIEGILLGIIHCLGTDLIEVKKSSILPV